MEKKKPNKMIENIIAIGIIGLAFLIGFIFRYEIANYYRSLFHDDKMPNEDRELVWKEINFEEGSGELLDTISDSSFLIDGVYYHLPCPLYNFVKNGWEVDIEGNSNKQKVYEVEPSANKVVSLKKDNYEIKIVSVLSPTNENVPIEEAYVSGFTIFSWDNTPIIFPNNLAVGMSKKALDELLEADGSFDSAISDTRYSIRFYRSESICSTYEISLKIEEAKVSQIRVEVWK